jgi:PhnB protein
METMLKPVLSVRNGQAAVEFYKSAFGAEEIFKVTCPDGGVVAELSIDGASFFVADESPSNGNFSPESVSGNTVRMALMLSDPDFIFDKALKAGAREVYPVADQDYGYRLGRLIDPYGHHWEIGRPINE